MLRNEDLIASTTPDDTDPTQLKKLSLSKRNITDREVEEVIVPYLREHPEIVTLDLSGNQITGRGLAMIAALESITTLDVSDNNIGPDGGPPVAANRSIINLYIRGNKLGDEGIVAVAANQTIVLLDAGSNRIKDAGIRALAANTTIRSLILADRYKETESIFASPPRYTLISADTAKALAANTTLIYLDIGNMDDKRMPKRFGDEEVIRILRELDPVKRANYGRDVGIYTGVPSLQRMSLYKAQQAIKDAPERREKTKISPILTEDLKKPRQ